MSQSPKIAAKNLHAVESHFSEEGWKANDGDPGLIYDILRSSSLVHDRTLPLFGLEPEMINSRNPDGDVLVGTNISDNPSARCIHQTFSQLLTSLTKATYKCTIQVYVIAKCALHAARTHYTGAGTLYLAIYK